MAQAVCSVLCVWCLVPWLARASADPTRLRHYEASSGFGSLLYVCTDSILNFGPISIRNDVTGTAPAHPTRDIQQRQIVLWLGFDVPPPRLICWLPRVKPRIVVLIDLPSHHLKGHFSN